MNFNVYWQKAERRGEGITQHHTCLQNSQDIYNFPSTKPHKIKGYKTLMRDRYLCKSKWWTDTMQHTVLGYNPVKLKEFSIKLGPSIHGLLKNTFFNHIENIFILFIIGLQSCSQKLQVQPTLIQKQRTSSICTTRSPYLYSFLLFRQKLPFTEIKMKNMHSLLEQERRHVDCNTLHRAAAATTACVYLNTRIHT